MKTILSSQNLDDAAELMNDFARAHSLLTNFDGAYFLSLAERGKLLPAVRLPHDFCYDRIDHRKCAPQIFPAHEEHFCLHTLVARDLISAAGKKVTLTHLLHFRGTGVVTFTACEPLISVDIGDLRITATQIAALMSAALSEHRELSNQRAESETVSHADSTRCDNEHGHGNVVRNVAEVVEPETSARAATRVVRNSDSVRNRFITVEVRKAVAEKNGCLERNEIFSVLREKALNSEPPFINVDGKALLYTDSKNEVKTATVDTIGAILYRIRKATASNV
jgi:hypothetical protein